MRVCIGIRLGLDIQKQEMIAGAHIKCEPLVALPIGMSDQQSSKTCHVLSVAALIRPGENHSAEFCLLGPAKHVQNMFPWNDSVLFKDNIWGCLFVDDPPSNKRRNGPVPLNLAFL